LGLFEALKWTRVGEAGFKTILKMLGPVIETLEVAYGPKFTDILRAHYRGGATRVCSDASSGCAHWATQNNADKRAVMLRTIGAAKLKEAARLVEEGGELPSQSRNSLGRFELAVDARIDAALTLAQAHYAGTARGLASVVSLFIALAVGFYLGNDYIFQALLVGVAAVPLAPMAKDLVSALQSAGTAIRTDHDLHFGFSRGGCGWSSCTRQDLANERSAGPAGSGGRSGP
jgi:hypothetical protein